VHPLLTFVCFWKPRAPLNQLRIRAPRNFRLLNLFDMGFRETAGTQCCARLNRLSRVLPIGAAMAAWRQSVKPHCASLSWETWQNPIPSRGHVSGYVCVPGISLYCLTVQHPLPCSTNSHPLRITAAPAHLGEPHTNQSFFHPGCQAKGRHLDVQAKASRKSSKDAKETKVAASGSKKSRVGASDSQEIKGSESVSTENEASGTEASSSAPLRLILLRHAKSSWDDPSLEDHERPLNKRGRKAAPDVAAQIRSIGASSVQWEAGVSRRSRDSHAQKSG
jgi:hypothetical protein